MARQQIVSYTLTCDVCGNEIPDSEAGDASRKISWEGTEYTVDLCVIHRAELADTLAGVKVFVDAGHRTPAGRSRRAAPRGASSRPATGRAAAASTGARGRASALAAVRAWALEHGHKVGDRGRIPAAIMAAYKEAQESDSSAPTVAVPKRRSRKASAA